MASKEPYICNGVASTIPQLSLDVNKLKTDITQIKTALKQLYSVILAESSKPALCIFCLKQQQWCREGHYLCLECDQANIKTNYCDGYEVRDYNCKAHNTKLAYKEDFDGY